MRPALLQTLSTTLASRPRRVLQRMSSKRDAAVLVPFCNVGGELHVLFTLRPDNVPTHKSQVAFPGGGVQPEDADVAATALREADEEVGLPRTSVDVLGLGDDAFSITAQRVTPVAGYVHNVPAWRPDPREVADIFTVPLAELAAPDGVYDEELPGRDGRVRRVPFFRSGKHTIWGLTAWIMRDLLTIIDGVQRGGEPNP
jgi:8-oxo-dGTP pyrophosphatase MutT (NUDIX family)